MIQRPSSDGMSLLGVSLYGSFVAALWLLWLLWLLTLLSPGCGSDTANGERRQVLTVFAPSSATEAIKDVAAAFERRYPAVDVRLNLAGTQVLRAQLEHGARADVLVSASDRDVAALVATGLLAEPVLIAHNRLTVAIPSANPLQIRNFQDLAKASKVVIGAAQVPVGFYTRQLFRRIDREMSPSLARSLRKAVASEEPNVRLVRAKVFLGEADAAFVYATDVLDPSGIIEVAVPAALNMVTPVLAASVKASDQPELGRAWLAMLSSAEGQQILANRGFSIPENSKSQAIVVDDGPQ